MDQRSGQLVAFNQGQLVATGKVKSDAIARKGHSDSRMIQSSFRDLIPLRQRADVGEISLERPDAEEVQRQKEKTAAALAVLTSGALAAQKPKTLKAQDRNTTFVRYTPTQNQMGDSTQRGDRIIKIVGRQLDPMEPPKFKHKKIPRGPPSPPPPVLHSPPRKLTAEDQEMWKIPPSISNWKNPKGYTIALDKRLASDGRGLQDVSINDKFSSFAEALYTADRHAREEVKQRALMQQKLAEKEKMQKEENLRLLAQKARDDRAAASSSSRRGRGDRSPRSRSLSSSSSRSASDDDAAREREEARKERRRDAERQLRQARMGTERKLQMMAREQGRDISEKIALGIAKPTATGESMYDSRLFNQSSGFAAGFNEDQPYDKPLFAAQEAISSIYRPQMQEESEDPSETMEKITKSRRFEGFSGAKDAEAREGPVQFERDNVARVEEARKLLSSSSANKGDDPFGIGDMIDEVRGGSGGKRYGLNEGGDGKRGSKRAKVD